MGSIPKINSKNEFDVLMDLGFEMEVPEGDSINLANSTARQEGYNDETEVPLEIIPEDTGIPIMSVNINDPDEPVPGESEWSQTNRMPAQEKEEVPKEELFTLLQEKLLYHPLVNQIKLDRYVRRLRTITF